MKELLLKISYPCFRLKNWKRKHKEVIKINLHEEKQAFDTHYNYSDCLESLTKKASLKFLNKLNKAKLPDLDSKKNLITLTLKSLKDEHAIVDTAKNSYVKFYWIQFIKLDPWKW